MRNYEWNNPNRNEHLRKPKKRKSADDERKAKREFDRRMARYFKNDDRS